MKNLKTVSWLCALCASLALTLNPSAFAQAPTAYHPGDVLSFVVSFDGAGADQIGSINLVMRLNTPPREDQPSFNAQFAAANIKPLGAGKFEVSTPIPQYAASGTFTLVNITAGPAELGGVWNYPVTAGQPPITITVNNDKHFAKPELKSVDKTSHP